tara:strand:- start:360 stop:749 length:390 start_codon:yes stop_codon:yes gene_type:complete
MSLIDHHSNNSDFDSIDFIDIFNIGSELNNFPDYSEIVTPNFFSMEKLFDLSSELDENDNDFSNIEDTDIIINKKIKSSKKRKEKDFNIQHNNEEYKRKKSIKICPNCKKIFYNGHALGGHLKYCNKAS